LTQLIFSDFTYFGLAYFASKSVHNRDGLGFTSGKKRNILYLNTIMYSRNRMEHLSDRKRFGTMPGNGIFNPENYCSNTKFKWMRV